MWFYLVVYFSPILLFFQFGIVIAFKIAALPDVGLCQHTCANNRGVYKYMPPALRHHKKEHFLVLIRPLLTKDEQGMSIFDYYLAALKA